MKNYRRTSLLILIATLLSCLAAFINKYPLVYSDTGSYIHSGFSNALFHERTIFYGLFLRHVSLSSSLWYVVFGQGLLMSYVIYLTLSMFFWGLRKDVFFLALITFLTLTTAYSFTVSILIPDIFSALTILCLVNLLLNRSLSRRQFIILSVIFVFSIATQVSSIAILGALLLVFGVYLLLKYYRSGAVLVSLKRYLISLSLFIVCIFVIPLVHFFVGREFRISSGFHVFAVNHLLETGILEDYLNKNCATKNYKVCEYKDQLDWNFIWSADGAFQKTGGWDANKQEYNEIVFEVATTPEYFTLLVQKAVEYSLKQFFVFDVEIYPPQLHKTAPFGQINWHFKDSVREYISSVQSAGGWKLDFLNFIQTWVILISFVFLSALLLFSRFRNKLSPELKCALILVILHNIINAMVCSNLSTIEARFQNRILWLLPLFALILAFRIVEKTDLFRSVLKRLAQAEKV